MIQAPDRVRISIAGGSLRPVFDKIDEKNVKQVLAEANETRRRSFELSERLKQFLAPMTVQKLSAMRGSGSEESSKSRTKPRSHLLTVQEDDVVEIINDVQDDNHNVMDIRVPRLEAAIKASKRPEETIKNHSGLSTESSNNSQQVEREYKILKQLLKDTEESNRRSNELVTLMEKTLASKERLVKPLKTKPKSKVKRTSDVVKSGKTELKGRESKQTSANNMTNKNETIIRKTRPKTTNEASTGKIKRGSKVKASNSTNAIKMAPPKAKRVSKTDHISKKQQQLEPLEEQSSQPMKSGPSGSSAVKDITEMIDAVGRRDTNNDEMRTYLNRFEKNVV